MKIKSSVSKRGYRGRVTIPAEVWEGMVRHGLDGSAWDRTCSACAAGSDDSGSDSYTDQEEWADYPTEGMARRWVATMTQAIEEMAEQVRQRDELRRLEDSADER